MVVRSLAEEIVAQCCAMLANSNNFRTSRLQINKKSSITSRVIDTYEKREKEIRLTTYFFTVRRPFVVMLFITFAPGPPSIRTQKPQGKFIGRFCRLISKVAGSPESLADDVQDSHSPA